MSEIDAAADAMLHAGMAAPDDPLFLSTLRVDAGAFAALHPEVERDADSVRVLRSVLMKPEHEAWLDPLHARLEALAACRIAWASAGAGRAGGPARRSWCRRG